jgi:hypothetical protein
MTMEINPRRRRARRQRGDRRLALRPLRPKAGERVGVVVSGGNTVAVDFDR